MIGLAERQGSVTFGAIRKALKSLWQRQGLSKDQKFNFEVSATGPKKDKREIPGNAVEASLHRIFGEAWETRPNRDRIRGEIAPRLREIDYRAVGKRRIEIRSAADAERERNVFVGTALREFDVNKAEADSLASLTLPIGWLRFSEAATRKLMPHLELGLTVPEALDRAYPDRNKPAAHPLERLPSDPRELPDIRNPTVTRTLTELRKVVNNLLAVHGKPDRIRIELARDLKLPPAKRAELDTYQRRQESRRKDAVDDLHANKIAQPSGDDIEKWLLWQECGKRCPYTGKSIGFDDLFRNGIYQAEHIFPRPRTLDNSFGNKTLCHADINRAKGNRSPYEAFGGDAERWDDVPVRETRIARGQARNRAQAQAIRWRRTTPRSTMTISPTGNSADTAYAAREARKLLQRLGVVVDASNGRVTRALAGLWGLHAILNPDAENKKNREDHRHHAIDALATAFASAAFVKRLSEHYAQERRVKRGDDFKKPWLRFFEDAAASVKAIVVSHRARRKVSGPLHEEKPLADTNETVVRDGITYRVFVRRKAVEELGSKEVDAIRDEEVKRIVRDHITTRGGDRKKGVSALSLNNRYQRPARYVQQSEECVCASNDKWTLWCHFVSHAPLLNAGTYITSPFIGFRTAAPATSR